MELNAITMDKSEARAHFLDYRRAVRERHNAEDHAIMQGYRALSQGKQIINLLDVMKAAGAHESGLPKLAIARADYTHCSVRTWRSGMLTMGDLSARGSGKIINFPADTMPPREGFTETARSVVPNIPPALRPAAHLRNYHILFEADWKRVPGDPALLKHAGGWLYIVLAVWDLTPLEQAVLGLTRN